MSMRRSYPAYGDVWFEGAPAIRAAGIYGTTNGWAVAVMELWDAKALLEGVASNVREDGDLLRVHLPEMGEDRTLSISKDHMVLFDGSWSLHHKLSDVFTGTPSPLPPAWRRRVNLDQAPHGRRRSRRGGR